jgi:recombination protein RecA
MSVVDAERYLEKKLGITLVRGTNPSLQIERISSGLLSLDAILGGGIPMGRILEIYGMPKLGKTSLALELVNQYLQRGWPVLYADIEHALDPKFAAVHGVDLQSVHFPVVVDGEDFLWGDNLLKGIFLLAKEWDHALFVVDSVPALIPHQLFSSKDENDVSDAPALTARLLSQYLKIFAGSGVLAKRYNTLLFINQLRNNIGSMYATTVRPGGNALPFYASVVLEVRRGDAFEDPVTKTQNGHELSIRVEKNKAGMAYQKTVIPLMYATGFDKATDVVKAGIEVGVITVRGSWYQWNEIREQGRDRFIEALEAQAAWDPLYSQVAEALQKGGSPAC